MATRAALSDVYICTPYGQDEGVLFYLRRALASTDSAYYAIVNALTMIEVPDND